MLSRLWRSLAVVVLALASVSVASLPRTAQAACSNPALTYGAVTVTYSIPTTGTYRVWSRIQAASVGQTSYYFQVDGGCAISMGGGGTLINQLVWIDYQNGDVNSKVDLTLAAGTHTFVLTGNSPDLMLDRVVFSADPACVPTGTGDNCAVAPTPSVTPTPTPTPSGVAADLNHDGKVNVFDLSLMLSNWGKTGTGDLNANGTVDVFDLSKLLIAWTG